MYKIPRNKLNIKNILKKCLKKNMKKIGIQGKVELCMANENASARLEEIKKIRRFLFNFN